MAVGFDAILNRLADQDLILPYFQAAVLADNWPDKYTVEVDSGPYYGAGDGYFHPSTHPLMGERELYYRFHPDTRDKMQYERNTFERQITFAIGSGVHAIVQTQMKMAGLVTDKEIEVEYTNTDHHVRGRIDWLTKHPQDGSTLLVELKTRTPRKFSSQNEPEPSWIAQVNLGLDAIDADMGILLMLEMGYPFRMTEFRIYRDQELLDGIYAKFDSVREAIANNTPPRYCCAPDSVMMKSCPARSVCWLKES